MQLRTKILAFADWYLPGCKGGGSVSAIANLIELLGAQWSFHVVTRDRDLADPSPYRGVSADRWVPVGKAQVFYTADLSFRNLRRRIREVEPEILYLNSFFSRLSIKTLLLCRLGLLPPTAVLLAPRGEFLAGALQAKSLRKRIYTGLARWTGLCRHLLWQASSIQEREQICRMFPRDVGPSGHRVHVARDVPGTNISQMQLLPARPEKQLRAARLIFLSRISRNKNLSFALDVLTGLKGSVALDIYGPVGDPAYWNKCSERAAAMPPNVVVRYCGVVPHHSVHRLLTRYDFLVLPSAGENFGHAILEALAAGCPVVTSDQTPWCGLEASGAGWELPLNDRQRWQAVLQSCIEMGPETYAVLSEQARRYASAWICSTPFGKEHLWLFREAMASKPPWSASEQPIQTL